MALEDGPPGSEGAQNATREEATDVPSRHFRNDAAVPNLTGSTPADEEGVERCHVSLWKKPIIIGSWNVRTMRSIGKLQLLFREMVRMKVSVMGLSEVRWRDSGYFDSGDHRIVYSGGTCGQAGVAVVLNASAKRSLISYTPVSSRILICRLNTKPLVTTLIQVYAPTSTHEMEESEQFYNDVQAIIDTTRRDDLLLVMGDFNAKVGDQLDSDCGIGKFGLGNRNGNGDLLAEFCRANDLFLCNTSFQHPERRRYTWVSPDGETRNQIDYFAALKRHRRHILDSKAYPGADCDSDHIPVCTKVRVRLHKQTKESRVIRYNLDSLKDPSIAAMYAVATKNRFEALSVETDSETQPEDLWQAIKEVYHDVAKSVLGNRRRVKRKQWITPETLEVVDKKRLAHQRKDLETFKSLKKLCRRKLRQDKNYWLARECAKIDELDWLQNSKAFFEQIRSVKRKSLSPNQVCMKDEQGHLISNPIEVLSRWKRYGETLFKKPPEERSLTRIEYEEREPPPLLEEVEDAISRLRNNKASGVDGIPAELIKHSGGAGAIVLLKLVIRIWETCVWPVDWRTQELIPLFKSGDKKVCSNYRTIAMISHASKILLLIVLQRMLKS